MGLAKASASTTYTKISYGLVSVTKKVVPQISSDYIFKNCELSFHAQSLSLEIHR